MSRRPGIRLPRAAALGLAALFPLVCGAAGRAVPRWWDIEVVLAAKGRYSVTERRSAPLSSRWVAKECLRTWGLIFDGMPASRA